MRNGLDENMSLTNSTYDEGSTASHERTARSASKKMQGIGTRYLAEVVDKVTFHEPGHYTSRNSLHYQN